MGDDEAKNKCGAKTRSGSLCDKPPASGRTRCRLHGGASPIGIGHPRYKNGLYSRYCMSGLFLRWERERLRRNALSVRVVEQAEIDAVSAYEQLCRAHEQRRALRLRGRPAKLPTWDDFLYQFVLLRVRMQRDRPKVGRPRLQAANPRKSVN